MFIEFLSLHDIQVDLDRLYEHAKTWINKPATTKGEFHERVFNLFNSDRTDKMDVYTFYSGHPVSYWVDYRRLQ